jgi:lipoate-protein ligase A
LGTRISDDGKVKRQASANTLSEPHSKGVWRLLDVEYADSCFNFSIEESIMEKVAVGESPNTIRFWRNPNITVVIGKYQIPELEVNRKAIKKYSAVVVRRFTGGGTVYNDSGNLNYSISVKREDPLIPSVVADIAPTLCKGVVEGLKILGLDAELKSEEGLYIQVDGKKVSGTAGKMRQDVVFVHGTLLVNSDLGKLTEILNVPPYPQNAQLKRFVRSARRAVTSIETKLNRRVKLNDVKEALRKGFSKTLGIQLRQGELSESELKLAKEIYAKNCDLMTIDFAN